MATIELQSPYRPTQIIIMNTKSNFAAFEYNHLRQNNANTTLNVDAPISTAPEINLADAKPHAITHHVIK